jgi:sugar transferase (PEP-CTERM/EpsH1 system associated)
MPSIQILHVVDSMSVGGLENGIVGLVNRMDPKRFSHAICCIRRSGPSAERLRDKSVPIFEMNKRDGKDFLLPFRLARLFRKVGADIVHTRNWGAIYGILAARWAGVPGVIHGEHGRDMNDPRGLLARRNFFRRATARWVDGYIAVSEDLRRWLTEVVGIEPGKVQTILNGVDTERFQPAELADKSSRKAQQGFGPNQVLVGTVGRLDPVKDQQRLLRACAGLRERHPNLGLVLVGDGPCREPLEKLAGELQWGADCRFMGLRSDVPEMYRLLDVFVLPSIAEGISNTILEAMASGLPVVATAVGGNGELVVAGETGALVPAEDERALGRALELYLGNPALRREHGAAGRRRAVESFSLERMVAGYQEAYLSVLAERAGAR